MAERLTDQLHITIEKELGKPKILLRNPQYSLADGGGRSLYEDGQEEDSKSQFEARGTGLELVLQKARGVYFNAKVLNLDDAALGRTVRNSYIMMVKCSVTHFSVMIVEMHTLKSIFHFKFKHTAPPESDIYVTPVTQVSSCSKLEDIKQHVIDAVKNLNSEHV